MTQAIGTYEHKNWRFYIARFWSAISWDADKQRQRGHVISIWRLASAARSWIYIASSIKSLDWRYWHYIHDATSIFSTI